jgi:RNA polymerase-binding transcription factor DksA
MERIRTDSHVDQLRKRREQIAMTLRHLGRERAELERNTVSREAYERRVRFLSSIRNWYVTDIEQIDKALKSADAGNLGLCAGCDELIEAHGLGRAESEFCYACQPYKHHQAEL